MPGPRLTEFYSDLSIPRSVDVVVVGGGIIGVSTALELADRGVSVLLCEKGQIGAEQSSRNWGWVRLGMRDPREVPLMQASLDIWQDLDARLGRATGFTRSGILFGASGKRGAENLARWMRHVDGMETGARMIEGAEIGRLLPGHQLKTKAALHMPLDGRAEPQWASSAIAEGARDRGAQIVTACAVRSLDVEAGRLSGVYTERGRVACSQVVLAGGAWSRLFAGNADVALPQLRVLNTVLRTSSSPGGPECALRTDAFAIRKRADGGHTIASGHQNTVDIVPDSFRLARSFLPAFRQEWKSLRFRFSRRSLDELRQARCWQPGDVTPFEVTRILDPEPSQKHLRGAWSAARRALPVLERAEIVQSWAGLIDVMPDAIPVISAVRQLPGLWIATGFSGHGFGIGPGAGRLMAELVTGETPVVDPWEFRLSRFTDGSRIAPDPGY
ncbi:NAD(P)/FAD-dependent oxidoreductase [Ruegeria marina]|uniref:Glycine/D-amino acid oxidase n=1 Tax=Ruegeria marina TaxID=639004 RepID=A0A1G6LYE5_9RHOB|nr:FAD-binding oxidoreductase [Ruegeria marina]SDC48318.1 Glycine/D-amino acid oxidase [Ruegeria marina]